MKHFVKREYLPRKLSFWKICIIILFSSSAFVFYSFKMNKFWETAIEPLPRLMKEFNLVSSTIIFLICNTFIVYLLQFYSQRILKIKYVFNCFLYRLWILASFYKRQKGKMLKEIARNFFLSFMLRHYSILRKSAAFILKIIYCA